MLGGFRGGLQLLLCVGGKSSVHALVGGGRLGLIHRVVGGLWGSLSWELFAYSPLMLGAVCLLSAYDGSCLLTLRLFWVVDGSSPAMCRGGAGPPGYM